MNLIKIDSQASLTNVEYLDEKKTRSKSNIGERELDFKNSFYEWNSRFLVSKPMANEALNIK